MALIEGTAVGIDWASGQWLAVVFEDGSFERALVEPEIRTLWERYRGADRILIDIPIGLISDGFDREEGAELSRRCDDLTRTLVSPRGSSVFPAPTREAAALAAEGKSHGEVSDRNQEITGKGLGGPSVGFAPAIHTVDEFLQEEQRKQPDQTTDEILLEAHPELCFRALSGEPLEHSKTTAPGFSERLDALESVLDQPATVIKSVSGDITTGDADVDDVLDAVVLAAAAGAPEGELHSVPPDPPEDAQGLPMQIVYRASEALEMPE